MLSKSSRSTYETKAEINITPLVDIMLVLLIIFIITAPLIRPTQLNINLPRTGAVTVQPNSSQKIEVALDAQGHVFLNGQSLRDTELSDRLSQVERTQDARVSLMIDESLPYHRVAEIMALLQQSGLNRLSFVLNSN